MRIALASFSCDPARGGAERYAVDLAQALRGRGHAADLLAAEGPGANLPADGLTRAGKYLSYLQALQAHLSKEKYDVVHAMLPVRECDLYHPHAGSAIAAYQTRRLNRFNRKRRLYAQVERKLLNDPAGPQVLCLSDYIQRQFSPLLPEAQDKLLPLFNGVDIHRFDPAGKAEDRRRLRGNWGVKENTPVALMIAQDLERKGLRQALEAMALANPFHLVVLTRQKTKPYQQLALKLGLAGHITFAPATADPRPYYRAADFFLLPTRHDPCSLVVLEALAMGLPVISTAQNGACQIMRHGVHGFVMPTPDDIAGLAEAINVLCNPAQCGSMSRAAVQLRSHLSIETHLQTLEEYYRLVIDH